MTEEESLAVLRIDAKLHKAAKDIADVNDMSLKSLVESAIEKEVARLRYSSKILEGFVKDHMSLKVHQDLVIKNFRDAPPEIIKNFMATVENHETALFKLKITDVVNKIKEYSCKNIHGIFIKISATRNYNPNHITEMLHEIDKFCNPVIKHTVIEVTESTAESEPEVLLFISLEEDKNATKK